MRLTFVIGNDPAGSLKTVENRHTDVHQDDVGLSCRAASTAWRP